MITWMAFSLGALVAVAPSILWLLILVWNAPELCDELRVDVRDDSNDLRLDLGSDEADRMLAQIMRERPPR